jgi:tryptophan 2,3-dioxygenase
MGKDDSQGNGGGNGGGKPSKTYADYLDLHTLLSLQGGEELTNDETHFIIVHQNFELWFKQIIRELREARDIIGAEHVAEALVPKAVSHLDRVTEIFRLMANQWKVMETLTPQGFLAFRDGLGTASGFESFQMREMEILLGLQQPDRIGEMDPLGHFRKLAKRGPEDAAVMARLEASMAEESLVDALYRWLARTPIQGSIAGAADDEDEVNSYVEAHLASYQRLGDEAAARMEHQGVANSDAVKQRFEAAAAGAREFLKPDGNVVRSRAGLLFIESYRELPLLTWPRTFVDAIVELEGSMVLWRTAHARMVERMIGRRVGTGGSSGVDYLDMTAKYRIFHDLWAVRTILIKASERPELKNPDFYGFIGENA